MLRVLFGAAWLLLLAPTFAWGEILLSNENFTYTQDFNTLATSGSSNSTMPVGWYFLESGTGSNATYAAVTFSGGAEPVNPNTYSFAWTASLSDRALGGIRGSNGSTFATTFGAAFTNNGSSVITDLSISYRGEQWYRGTVLTRDDRLDFQYSTNATGLGDGDWIDVNQLDFSSPVIMGSGGRLNGNLDANSRLISYTLTGLNIAPGETFWIRWTDFDVADADDGLAIDDFSLVARFGEPASVPEPTTTAALAFFSAGGWVARRLFQRRNRDKKAA